MFILPIEDDLPAKRFPFVNLSLIAANVYFFFKTAASSGFEQIVHHYGFTSARPEFTDVFSSMFLHAGLGHLLGNMYFLYVFGDNVEERAGHFKYLLAYLGFGVGAVYLQYAAAPHSPIPLIGASGAISGVCALYMLMFPWRKLRLHFFFLIFPIFSLPARAFFLVGAWFAMQYLMASASDPNAGGVAFWAHVGGFLTGVVLFPYFYWVYRRRTRRS